MIQIIKPPPSFAAEFAKNFAGGATEGYFGAKEKKQQQEAAQKRAQQIQKLTGLDLSDQTPEMQEKIVAEHFKQMGKENLFNQKKGYVENIFSGNKGQQPQGQSFNNKDISSSQEPQDQMNGFDASKIRDEDIAQASVIDPNLARSLQHAKDVALREQTAQKKAERKEFESERSYHTGFSKEEEKSVNQQRSSIPKKEMALNFARDAIQSGDMSYFSPDKLADSTGIDLFRTAKGAQLITAGKENLLNNMGRVSARAQNIWFEQRLNSMFPKIGQSQEANLTVQEMLEGELELDKAYVREFDRLSQEDEKKYGYVKKDIAKRAQDAIKSESKEILNRTSYRMKEIEEREKGISSLKKQVGHKVPKGTPLTQTMAKLYLDKFGDNALATAKANGYTIPTFEEYQIYKD